MDAATTAVPEQIREYLKGTCSAPTAAERNAQLEWRLYCHAQGQSIARTVAESRGSIRGQRVIDLAAAWGGHAFAFAAHGAVVIGGDLNDHSYATLSPFSRHAALPLYLYRGSCEELPIASSSVDIAIALELIEHIPSPERLAAEVARILRPGGMAVVSTPPRFKSILGVEPHFALRGLALLPFRLQRPVAERLFGRRYPFPITRQYSSAREVAQPFVAEGLRPEITLGGRLEALAARNRFMDRLLRSFAWKYILFHKPAVSPSSGDPTTRV